MLEGVLQGALAVLIGAVVVRWTLLRRLTSESERNALARQVATAGMYAGFLGMTLIPLKVWAQVAAFLEPGEPFMDGLRTILLTTDAGKATLVQAIWVSAASVAFAVARHGNVKGWRAASVAAAFVAVTPALGGHAATASSPQLAITAAVLHVVGAAAWLGGLFHLWRLSHATPEDSLRVMIRAFHPVAIGSASIVALSGLYRAWIALKAPADLVQSAWGALLLTKLALLAVVAWLGYTHWRGSDRRVARGDRAGLVRSFATELALAAAVFIVTGLLATSEPPM